MNRTAQVFCGFVFICAIPAAAQEPHAESPPDAMTVLREVFAHYRSLDSYSATVSMDVDMVVENGFDLLAGMAEGMSQEITVRIQQPNQVYYERDDMIVVCNGQTLAFGMPMMMQYFEQDVADAEMRSIPAQIQMMTGGMAAGTGGAELLDPVSMIFHDEPQCEEFLGELGEVAAERVVADGVHRIRVTALLSADVMPGMLLEGQTMPIEMWIDPDRLVFTRHQIDLTDTMNAMFEQMANMQNEQMFGEMKYERMVATINLIDQQLNPALDGGAFNFDWDAEGFVKAGSDSPFAAMFGAQTSQLAGLDAPEIESRTIEGDAFALSELRGNVVVLDFWATWCGPCVQAMPKIQELHEHFAGEAVRVVGMNQDDPSALASVRSFLEDRKISFMQVLDSTRRIGQAYEVSGIPTTVIIDQTGVIQAVHVGYTPGSEDRLRDQIQTLLDGGALLTEDEKERAETQREAMKEVHALEAREDTGQTKEIAFEEQAPQTIVEVQTHSGGAYSYGTMTLLDIDGDGQDELLVPSPTANYSILFADGESETLRLQGTPRQAQGTIAIAQRDNERHYAYSASLPTMTGGTRLIHGLWRQDGTRIWSSEVTGEGQTSLTSALATGDLNGDGQDELVVAVSKTEFNQAAEGAFPMPANRTAYLSVYDFDGNCLARREAGSAIWALVVTEHAEGGALIAAQTDRGIVRYAFDPDAMILDDE